MINLIHDLFESYGFIPKEVTNGYFFETERLSNKTAFWLVIKESDMDSLLKRQTDLFDDCKRICQHAALDKNLSMLVLWETNGNLEISEMKKKIMLVEEDDYFFKKNVLYFSAQESESLKEMMGDQSLFDFIETEVTSQKTFNQYKKISMLQNWQSLLYRIAIKVPFIEIKLDISDGLTSLFENNRKRLMTEKYKTLFSFDHCFFEILDSKMSNEIKTMKATDLLAELGEEVDGN